MSYVWVFFFFFFNDTATTEIYTLSLHDALPIFPGRPAVPARTPRIRSTATPAAEWLPQDHEKGAEQCSTTLRSEEHTSELQSQSNLVCRLLLEKKKNTLMLPLHYLISYMAV